MALFESVGETMIQIGDLVKYKKHSEGQRDKGVWLVVNVEIDEFFVEIDGFFGELVTLKQGNEQRLTHASRLNKISSCR